MPEAGSRNTTRNTVPTAANTLKILQINLNKSEKAHLELINGQLSKTWDIILIQELHTTVFNYIRTPTNFRPVYPENRGRDGSKVRSAIWVNKKLETKHWKIIDIPDTNDITAIQMKGEYGKLTIFNIYNDCTHSRNEDKLKSFIRKHANKIIATETDHMIWAGDFNRHHPLWDRSEDTHLFTREAITAANGLIDLLDEYGMEMALPKGIPTLQHMRSKRYSRPDNVFCTQPIMDHITRCEVDTRIRPPCTDHFPIATTISLPQHRIEEPPSYDFRNMDWEEFRTHLVSRLEEVPDPEAPTTKEQLHEMVRSLTEAIQDTIRAKVTLRKPRPDSKRWWNGDLKRLKRELNKLRANSYRFRALTDHPIHAETRRKSNQYGEEIVKAKRQHWAEYLEEVTENNIWATNRYLKEPSGDGGNPRIPTLKVKNNRGEEIEVNDNRDKAKYFAKTFFPPPPRTSAVPTQHEYPQPLPDPPAITKTQIAEQISRLSPYKASGPDGIPNIILIKCFDLLEEYLIHIIQAILGRGWYYDPWREFTTVVLRKPGKPNYQAPKAYRPIALLCTMAKLVTALVASDLSHLVETHNLLPNTHFGG